MSQIEQSFRRFLSKYPEIEKCYSLGLINRRALARHLIKKEVANKSQMDAVIAMLRRHDFSEYEEPAFEAFTGIKTSIKDNLTIFNLKKTSEILKELGKITSETDFTTSETLKIIVGTTNVTIIVDSKKKELEEYIESFELIHRIDNVSELSIQFPEKAIESKGVIASITRELYFHDIIVSELITASHELSMYLEDRFILEAYKTIKNFF